MTDNEILKKLLDQVRHMVVAVTLEDGTPWAVPVFIKHREGRSFEWDSSLDAEHSKAIAQNPKVSLVIFSVEQDLGFYAKATAEELPNTRRDDGRATYRTTVTECWLNEKHTKRPIKL